MPTYMSICIDRQTVMHVCLQTQISICIYHTDMHVVLHTYLQASLQHKCMHTLIHTYMHTYLTTYLHTYMQACIFPEFQG